jgi:hypothetical protein
MPTYRHSPTGKRVLMIHIPRTAGRFVDTVFKRNELIAEHQYGIVESHFHKELYEKHLDVEGIPHIAVVRNPIDRFFSSSILLKQKYGPNVGTVIQDWDDFNLMVNSYWINDKMEGVLSDIDIPGAVKFLRPQVDYITDETYVWKFEDGFGDAFGDWVSDVLNIPFKVRDVPYPRLRGIDEGNKLEVSDSLKENIRNYYSEDFKRYYLSDANI